MSARSLRLTALATSAALLTAAEITNREECLADTDTHPTCRFALTFSSLPAGLRVGSVLNAGITPTAPTGLLVKVTGIDQNRLPDALTRGEFWHEQAFSPELRAVVWPADGEVIRLGRFLPRKVEASAIDPEDGPLTVRWTDLADNVTVEGVGPQTVPFRKLGTHALQASAVDADGAAVERVISVRVEAPSLSLSLHLLHVDGAAFDGSPSDRPAARCSRTP